jgi:hypothetical protein
MSNIIEERLDDIEARIERLERLYGINHFSVNWNSVKHEIALADDTQVDLGEFIKKRLANNEGE